MKNLVLIDGQTAELLFDVMNTLFIVSVIPSVYRVLKHRDSLNGHSLIGAILTTAGLCLALIAYEVLGYYNSILLTLPTLLFWFLKTIFLVKNHGHVHLSNVQRLKKDSEMSM